MNEFAGSNRRVGFLTGVLAVLLVVLVCQHAHAATPVPNVPIGECITVLHNGVTQFSATDLDPRGNTWNFSGDCNTPPPPNDPGAYTTLGVTWLTHTPVTQITDVTQFANVVGHILPTLPIQQWSFASGATVKMLDNSPKYLRMRFHMPSNPGTISHFLKATSYGALPGLRAKFALVAAGAAWPTGVPTPCWKPSEPFSDQVVLNINPGAPNTSKCSAPAGSDYDVLIDALTSGTVAVTWN